MHHKLGPREIPSKSQVAIEREKKLAETEYLQEIKRLNNRIYYC